jgi:hypothetical protein
MKTGKQSGAACIAPETAAAPRTCIETMFVPQSICGVLSYCCVCCSVSQSKTRLWTQGSYLVMGWGHCRMSTECCAFWTMRSDVGIVMSPLTSHPDWLHRSTSGPEHDHPYLRRHLRVVSTTPTLHSTATSGGPKHHEDKVRVSSSGPSHGSYGDKGSDPSATPQRRHPSHRVNAEGMRHLGRMQTTR